MAVLHIFVSYHLLHAYSPFPKIPAGEYLLVVEHHVRLGTHKHQLPGTALSVQSLLHYWYDVPLYLVTRISCVLVVV